MNNLIKLDLKETQKVNLIKFTDKRIYLSSRLCNLNKILDKKKDMNKLNKILDNNEEFHQENDNYNSLYDENNSLSKSFKMASKLVLDGKNSMEEITKQNNTLSETDKKLEIILNKIPFIGKIIDEVGYYKFREQVILGIVTGTCCYILLSLILG